MPNRKPSVHQLKPIPGYEEVTFEQAPIAPSALLNGSSVTPTEVPVDNVDGYLKHSPRQITRDNVFEALHRFMNKKHSLRWRSLRDIRITEVVFKNVMHYSLETYTEKRFLSWAFEPYKGGKSETCGPESEEPAPDPWTVEVERPVSGLFKDGEVSVEVPNTSQIGICHECVGIGRTRCDECKADGGKKCLVCSGAGTCRSGWGQVKCKDCEGRGRKKCNECKGHGQIKCDVCKKKCRLRYYVTLTVRRVNNSSHELSHSLDLPRKLILAAEGDVLWEGTDKRVSPIRHIPDEFLIMSSDDVIKRHEKKLTNERILHQRQRVRSIPVAEVHYDKGQRLAKFFVLGLDHKVHIPDSEKPNGVPCNLL